MQDHFENSVLSCMEPLCLKYNFSFKEKLRKGFAIYLDFEGKRFDVEFVYGPPGYEVQMFIKKNNHSYTLGELMTKFDEINVWVRDNKDIIKDEKDPIKLEIRWFTILIEQIMNGSVKME